MGAKSELKFAEESY
nr:hypothetical protein [Acinetobacter kyonggiensis]